MPFTESVKPDVSTEHPGGRMSSLMMVRRVVVSSGVNRGRDSESDGYEITESEICELVLDSDEVEASGFPRRL